MLQSGSRWRGIVHFENAADLEAIFGYWPSFHDAEVLRVVLDRSGDEGPTLQIVIQVFEMTSEVDAKGYYVLKNHTEVALSFTKVVVSRLQWFNHQNVLSSLEIDEIDPAATRVGDVELPSSFGLEAVFECERAIVTDVRSFESAV